MPYRLTMVGHYAGKTIKINGNMFVNGVLDLPGQAKDYEFLARYYETFGAYPDGHEKLKGVSNGSGSVQVQAGPNDGGVSADKPSTTESPAGSGDASASTAGTGGVSEGNGAASGSVEQVKPSDTKIKLAKIIHGLSPENNDHWTDAGKPRLSVIEEALGAAGVSRADVEAAAPGWTREKAAAEI